MQMGRDNASGGLEHAHGAELIEEDIHFLIGTVRWRYGLPLFYLL